MAKAKTAAKPKDVKTKKKEKAEILVAPAGIASYSYLNEPDTKGKFADDKYKVTVLYPKENAEEKHPSLNQEAIDAYIEKINALHKAAGGRKGGDKDPVKDGDKKDNEEYHGYWMLRYKTGYPPALVDTKRKALPDNVKVYSGDIIKVSFDKHTYDDGLSLSRLRAVMLIDKRNTGNGGAGVAAFDDEDGFTVSDDGADEKESGSKRKSNGDF